MMTERLIPLIVVLMFVLVGCEPGQESAPAATPMQAIRQLHDALDAGDEDAFLACFDATEDDREFLHVVFDYDQTIRNFDRKTVAAFGRKVQHLPVEPSFVIATNLPPEDLIWSQTDEYATCQSETYRELGVELRLRANGWLILPSHEEITPEDIRDTRILYGAFTPVFNEMADRANEEGMTLQTFRQEFDRKFSAAAVAVASEQGWDLP